MKVEPTPLEHTQRDRTLSGAILIALFSLGLSTGLATAAPDFVPGRILIKPNAALHAAQVRGFIEQHGAVEEDHIPQIGVRILRVPEERQAKVLEALSHNPNVEFAELDGLVPPELIPNDARYSSEWHLPKIAAPDAWNSSTGAGITIAILDTGVNGAHPDLAGQIVPGWNIYDNNSDTTDVHGHGTGVAGMAAAVSNNGIGVASVAWNAKIMPIRISDPAGYASFSAMGKALTWAADHGARVANLSFKASESSTVATAAKYFQSKRGVVTVAAGNAATFSSAADNPYVLTVSATDQNDLLATWSNTGNNIDLCAPGVNIYTTTRSGGYGVASGTSASAPLVAGVAALVMAANSSLSGSDVQSLLENTADDLGSKGWDSQHGYGRLNAYRAVLAATAGTPPPAVDATPPNVQIASPVNGSTLSGSVAIMITATDDAGVAQVDCYLNGTRVASSQSGALNASWDTTTAGNGTHTIQAVARDAAGNSATAASVISVQNTPNDTVAPSVRIVSPADGATISKTIKISVSAADNVGIAWVQLYVDGALFATSPSASATFTWNASKAGKGGHTLQAVACDTAGNRGTSLLVKVSTQ